MIFPKRQTCPCQDNQLDYIHHRKFKKPMILPATCFSASLLVVCEIGLASVIPLQDRISVSGAPMIPAEVVRIT